MEKHYTAERNVQIVIALMKAHGVRYVVASPGATNVTLVGSLQQDPFSKSFPPSMNGPQPIWHVELQRKPVNRWLCPVQEQQPAGIICPV